jgi:4-alpha-glucanotransferase
VRRYLSVSGADIAGDLTRAALRSVADGCVIQMQDLLRLPGSCRMNVPGRAAGNWGWRMLAEALDPGLATYLNEQIRLAGRTGHDLVSAPEGAP